MQQVSSAMLIVLLGVC